MRGRVTLLALAAVAAACLSGAPTEAAPGDSTRTDTDKDKGTIIPTAGRLILAGGGSGSRCTWEKLDGRRIPGTLEGSFTGDWQREGPAGTDVLYFRSACSNGRPDGFFWVPPVRVSDLRDEALRRVEKQLPLPSTNINPDPAAGGFVNLGLWLAIDDPGAVSATAAVGPVWVTIFAEYGVTTWDMGNGDSFDCEGLGTPIVDLNTVEQGPCGYTFGHPSAPKYTGDGLAYHASVTGTWAISWVDYTGAAGSLDSLQRTTSFDYQVREIQTVGVAEP